MTDRTGFRGGRLLAAGLVATGIAAGGTASAQEADWQFAISPISGCRA
jgi:hypothetical protein